MIKRSRFRQFLFRSPHFADGSGSGPALRRWLLALLGVILLLPAAAAQGSATLTGRTSDGRAVSVEWTPATAANSEGYQRLVERRLPEGLTAFDRALALAREEGWPEARLAGIHAGRAQVLYQLGRFSEARTSIEIALPHEQATAQAGARFLLADIARAMGDFRTATDLLRQLDPEAFVPEATRRPAARERATEWARQQIFVSEARNRRAWGDLLGAREMFEAALKEEQPSVGIRRDYARTLLALDEPRPAFTEAQNALHQALNERGTSRRRPRGDWVRVADMELISCLQVAAQCAVAAGEGMVADAHFETAGEMASRLGVPDEALLARLSRAAAWVRLRDTRAREVTAAWLDRIGIELRASTQPRVRIEGLTLAGELAYGLGENGLVTRLLEPAVEDVEAVRATASLEDRREFLALQADSYRRLVAAHTRLQQPWEALLAAESLKARQLLELIQPGAAGETRARRVAALRDFQRRLPEGVAALNYANADWAGSAPVVIVVTRSAITAVELPMTGLRLSLEFLPRDRILAAQQREVDVNRYGRSEEITLAGLIAFYREALAAPFDEINTRVPDLLAVAPVLNDLLIEPLMTAMGSSDRLLIAPSGLLHYLPFDSLVNREGMFVTSHYTMTLTPSFLITLALADRAPATYDRSLLAFGGAVYNPKDYAQVMAGVDDLRERLRLLRATRENQVSAITRSPYFGIFGGPSSNLAGTQAEVEEIGDTLDGSQVITGREVSEPNVRRLASVGEFRRSRAIHFAVHGSALPHRPELSCLSLSYEGHFSRTMPADRDGKLSLAEIRALPIRADLVTLSACETGLGAIFAGEGVVGLTSAFLTAGGDRVLASLWPVNDVATTFFMVEFYRLHFVEGMPGDLAVARVKREFLANRPQGFRHPQFWAPFNLYGGGDLLEPRDL